MRIPKSTQIAPVALGLRETRSNVVGSAATIAIVSAIVFSIGAVAIIGYAGGISEAYGWGKMTSMAVLAATGFLMLSTTLFAWSWYKEATLWPRWLPAIGAVAGLVTTLLIWQGLIASTPGNEHSVAQMLMLLCGIAATLLLTVLIEALFRLSLANRNIALAKYETERYAKVLERKTEELEDFSRIASHDLKSPLRRISNLIVFAEEDCDGQFPPGAVEHMSMAKEQTVRMTKLIDDLLQYSRAGRQDDELQTVNTHKMANRLPELLDVPESMQVHITGEPTELKTYRIPLESCLRNLVSNAIQHRDELTTQVTIDCSHTPNYVEFAVTDDGPGIDAAYHERIFGLFEALKSKHDQPHSTGLGLAFVKKTAEAYGGSITLESPGQERGACFKLRWPRAVEVSELE